MILPMKVKTFGDIGFSVHKNAGDKLLEILLICIPDILYKSHRAMWKLGKPTERASIHSQNAKLIILRRKNRHSLIIIVTHYYLVLSHIYSNIEQTIHICISVY